MKSSLKSGLLLAALLFVGVAAVSVDYLPGGSAGAANVERLEVKNATRLVIHSSDLVPFDGETYYKGLYAKGVAVKIDSLVNIEELVYVKEEIVIRVSDFNRVYIVSGDNGEF